ncbi:hypothetical protein BK661_20715 [Pseudomonas frederiksbergensis]|uniref:DUF2628 domain-containing protein n=1 Tax=Pseudomonas frederiksbergensis TaxID=104087 RepID=A0A423IWG9_9PSED|nr:hypothetical protein [Pseudomonas frederiksbergensis]RON29791.1 hypothetical protein BK661_20715 [Pseudomonas frederiksbergensis]
MARYFKNPESNETEEVGAFQVLAIFFLGPIYLFFAQLWPHLLIWVIAIGLGVMAGPPWMGIPVVCLPIGYCFFIRKIVADVYLKKGWKEVPDPSIVGKQPTSESK